MIRSIKLENFRNHTKLELSFGGVTILLGPNGAGKTNVVEAIRLLSLLKSFRARNQKELIKWNEQAARVIGKIGDQTIEFAISVEQKLVKLNGVKKSSANMIGLLQTVLFTPEDVSLLSGAPSNRRRFLDSMLVQKDKHYLIALSKYQQVLRQRNAALEAVSRGLARRENLSVWDGQLIELGQIVHQQRKKAVEIINNLIVQTYQKATGGVQALLVEPKWSQISADILSAAWGRDIALQSTTKGPHHDDFAVLFDGKDIGRFGSRGENRTAVVALKLAELEYLGKDAVLLLDDIFSELDHNRRERLQQLIQSYQTIITTTDEHYISSDLMKAANIVKLN